MIAKAGPMGKMQMALESFVTALVCQTGSQLMSKMVLVPITRNPWLLHLHLSLSLLNGHCKYCYHILISMRDVQCYMINQQVLLL